MAHQITEEDYKNWWASPVGQEVRRMLTERANTISNITMGGVSIEAYHNACGKYQEIQDLLAMTYQEMMGEI